MKRMLLVAKRDYLATVKTKGFIIGLVIAPIFMGGSGIAFALLRGQVDTRDRHLAVLDHSGVVAPEIERAAKQRNEEVVFDEEKGGKVQPAYVIQITPPAADDPDQQRLELSDRVRAGKLHGFVEIGPEVLHPGTNTATSYLRYYARNAAFDDLRRWLDNTANNHLRRTRLTEAGLAETDADQVFRWVSLAPMRLVSREADTGEVKSGGRQSEAEAILPPLILLMLMFLMMMMGAAPLLNSVMEEKTQRIAEVLLGSIRPFELMLGKLLGGLAVSLTGAGVYLGLGLFALMQAGLMGYVPVEMLPWFLVYLLSAVLMIGAWQAALGSICSDVRDAQSMTLPGMLPAIIPMFVIMPVLKEPLSGFATVMSLLPPFTPLLMMLRQASGAGIPAWQPYVGLTGVVLTTLASIWLAGRIFRVGILSQGKLPGPRQMLRWLVKG
jgi:ABC-2 type transport system permease protein